MGWSRFGGEGNLCCSMGFDVVDWWDGFIVAVKVVKMVGMIKKISKIVWL
jgi:hypothetical protein